MTAAALAELLQSQKTEDDMFEELRAAARTRGWLLYHTHDARHSASGFPDVVALKDGRLYLWELKRERGKTTPAQDAWLAAFAAFIDAHDLGRFCEARVVRPSDLKSCLLRLLPDGSEVL